MRVAIFCFCIFLFSSLLSAETPNQVITDPNQIFNPLGGPYKSPDIEHRTALFHLRYATLRESRPFIKYFTFYSIPLDKHDDYVRILNGWIHHLVDCTEGGKIIAPIERVTDTLYCIDLRNYGWTNEAWDIIAQADSYIRQPWISDEDFDEIERLMVKTQFAQASNFVSTNVLLRADWFIYHTSDPMAQQDVGKEPLYYILPYSTFGVPKNAKEFRAAWGVDAEEVESNKLATGVIIKQNESIVARNNRQIARVNSPFGYYYETSDVKATVGDKNYIDNLQPYGLAHHHRDAGEIITVNRLGLQVYFLINGKEERIEFADPTIARDTSGNADIRVKTGRSCIICHPTGLNDVVNHISHIVDQKIDIYSSRKEYQEEINKFFLKEDFNLQISNDRKVYSNAINKVTGWSPEEFATHYKEFMEWYEGEINREQASLECGVSLSGYINNIKSTPTGTLSYLLQNGTVSRQTWEQQDTAPFVESMLLLYKAGIAIPTIGQLKEMPTIVVPETKTIRRDSSGEEVEIIKEDEEEKQDPKPTTKPTEISESDKLFQNLDLDSEIRFRAIVPLIDSNKNTTIITDLANNDKYEVSRKKIAYRKVYIVNKESVVIRTLNVGEVVYTYKGDRKSDFMIQVFFYPQPTKEVVDTPLQAGYISRDQIAK